MARTLEFWFSIGSTYTYLTVARIEAAAAAAGVPVAWRPFNVRRIMQQMDNRFLAGKPEKYAHMWRDIARRAEMYGIPCTVPVTHPLPGFDVANRVAILAWQEGWLLPYVKAAYHGWFVEGRAPGEGPNLGASLRAAGQDPARVLPLAEGAAVEAAYVAATEEARGKGIFGAPSFIVEGELFWGDDRLEDALSWAKHGRVLRQP